MALFLSPSPVFRRINMARTLPRFLRAATGRRFPSFEAREYITRRQWVIREIQGGKAAPQSWRTARKKLHRLHVSLFSGMFYLNSLQLVNTLIG
jgi:hypothetical protein